MVVSNKTAQLTINGSVTVKKRKYIILYFQLLAIYTSAMDFPTNVALNILI